MGVFTCDDTTCKVTPHVCTAFSRNNATIEPSFFQSSCYLYVQTGLRKCLSLKYRSKCLRFVFTLMRFWKNERMVVLWASIAMHGKTSLEMEGYTIPIQKHDSCTKIHWTKKNTHHIGTSNRTHRRLGLLRRASI